MTDDDECMQNETTRDTKEEINKNGPSTILNLNDKQWPSI